MPNENATRSSNVLILDFGSQFTQLIARSVRSLGVYCEIEPYSISLEKIQKKNPGAIILSGGPASVTDKKSPKLLKSLLHLELPVLGICYGMQLLSHEFKGKLSQGTTREYGLSFIEVLDNTSLFAGFKRGEKLRVWMSHGDSVSALPEGAKLLAKSDGCPIAAIQKNHFYGVQFHPEVFHTPIGPKVISNFLFEIAGLKNTWKISNFLEAKAKEIKEMVGDAEVIGGVSGGVDSTILAVFLSKVLKNKFHPILVDHGFMRLNEAKEVAAFMKTLGVNLKVVSSQKLFLKKLTKVEDPEKKRKISGKTFIDVFEKECKRWKKAKFLAQGTLYPDVIESVSVKGPSHTIKTHHNVGGLPKRMKLGLIEPFRELFKDEVRELGRELGIPEELIGRHPFPGPGLAIRILGEVTQPKVQLLQKADSIYVEELKRQNFYKDIWQAFAVLLPTKSVGVMGDQRTYENVLALRAVTSRDGMTADWFGFPKEFLEKVSNRIINEVRGVNRVVYDVSSKPPATIEWE